MANQPVLVLPSFEKLFVVVCAASNIVVGAILSQEGGPMEFFSERLNETKIRYLAYDLELYALVQALKKWRYYMLLKKFVIFIDNQELSFINSQEKLSLRHIKWMEFSQSYTFTIKHKKGRRLLTIQEVNL